MKQKNVLKSSIMLAIAAAFIFYSGCGDDSTTTGNNNNGGTPPTINMKVGSVYTMNVDSIQTNGTITPTRYKTIHTYLSQGSFHGQSNVFQIRVVTQDSVIPIPLVIDTFYVRYDAGKFYQWGVIQLLDPTISPTWDLIADFTVSQGTQWSIANNIAIHLGSFNATANIKGKVAADTTFITNGWDNKSVNSYRSEISAEILISGLSVGTVYVDYFIGDSDPVTNPAGLVRLRLRPISLTVYTAAGVDQKMQHWTMP